MIILGLDPGIGRTGFGVIDTSRQNVYVRCGCLTTPAHMDHADRLELLGKELAELIAIHQPDQSVVEEVFFGKNHKTAMQTAAARGVLLYILRTHHIPISSLTPLQIKSRLTGYGTAPKEQIQRVIQNQLHLDQMPQPDDAADALAAALCYST